MDYPYARNLPVNCDRHEILIFDLEVEVPQEEVPQEIGMELAF